MRTGANAARREIKPQIVWGCLRPRNTPRRKNDGHEAAPSLDPCFRMAVSEEGTLLSRVPSGSCERWRRSVRRVGHFDSSAVKSNDALSMWKLVSFVPSGTRKGNVHEYAGMLPASTNATDVL